MFVPDAVHRWCRLVVVAVIVCGSFSDAGGADWSHWRGPSEVGAAGEGPELVNAIPPTGLKPLWSRREIPSARSGGWSSPTVAEGRVVVFTHRRVKVGEGQLPRPKYPYLAPDKRTGMTEEEYAKYEQNRRDEQQRISQFYRYDEVVMCFDAATGKDLWSKEKESVYTRFPQSGSPTINDGKLYVLGAGRIARCLSLENGETVWETKLPGEFRDEFMQSSFLVEGNSAVVLARQLFALDTGTGKVLWASDESTTKGSHSSPMLWRSQNNPNVIVNVGGGVTACFDLASGKERWRVKSEANHSSPVIAGDKLLTYGSSRKAGLRCFQLSDTGAEPLWTFNELADKGSTPVVLGDFVYVQGERKLACVELATGNGRWVATMEMSRPQYTSLIGGDGKLMYTYDGLLMFAASPEKYQKLTQAKINEEGLLADEATFRKLANMDELEKTPEGRKQALRLWNKMFKGHGPLACSSPALADGRLYIRLQDGLVCYDLATDSNR